jgi:hypothetical protein
MFCLSCGISIHDTTVLVGIFNSKIISITALLLLQSQTENAARHAQRTTMYQQTTARVSLLSVGTAVPPRKTYYRAEKTASNVFLHSLFMCLFLFFLLYVFVVDCSQSRVIYHARVRVWEAMCCQSRSTAHVC